MSTSAGIRRIASCSLSRISSPIQAFFRQRNRDIPASFFSFPFFYSKHENKNAVLVKVPKEKNLSNRFRDSSRKEVFQPHLPVRLPCYDLAPVTSFTLGRSSRLRTSGTPGSHGLTGGVYKARERIHRAMADARLLANPASWGRVADPSPNWDRISRLDATCIAPSLCTGHCNTCVAPDVRAVLI